MIPKGILYRKKIFALIVVFALVAALFVPLVVAEPDVLDIGSIGSSLGLTVLADYLRASRFNTSDLTAYNTSFTLVSVHAHLYESVSGVVGLKAMLISNASVILATSNETSVSGGSLGSPVGVDFYFNTTQTVDTASAYYYMGIISNNTCYIVGGDGSNYRIADSSNNFASPTNPTDYTPDYYNQWAGFIIRLTDESGASGATPTPVPSDSGENSIEELTNIILPWLVPLLICLIPALLGYKFVGELGFFIGLNVGCILAYVTLASTAYAFPLWGIILVGVMDVAVVLMRR